MLRSTYSSGTLNEYHTYLYDGMGNQVRDRKYDGSNTLLEEKFYIYDANNTKLATYHKNTAGPAPYFSDMWVDERYLYGSERLATVMGRNVVAAGIVMYPAWEKVYELHDHLGNVRATFNWWHPAVIPPTIPVAYTSSYHNMYAFGAPHPNRYYESIAAYHWGFNGQERKDDLRGIGNSYDFKYRSYDDRIGRFTSVDPLDEKFPWNSPYAFCENRVIEGKDLEGREFCRYDCDSYDPNVKLMAEWDGVKNYRDSKNYQIFNDARNKWSGNGGIVEGMAGELVFGPALAKTGRALFKGIKGYQAALFMSNSERIVINTTKNVWKLPWPQRGLIIEKALGGNLPKNFPIIDKFAKGVAESIKSIDLGSPTYQSVSKLRSQLKKYVDDLANFEGASFDGFKVGKGTTQPIQEKVLTVAFEAGKWTKEQAKVFAEIVEYAKEKAVKVVTKAVE